MTPLRAWTLVSLFVSSALFHAFALQWPQVLDAPPFIHEGPEQHVLFVLVNLWLTNELAARRPYEFPPLRLYAAVVLLSVHQLVVHGTLLVLAAVVGQADFQSATVLGSLVVMWLLLTVKPRSP